MEQKQKNFKVSASNFGPRGWVFVIYGLLAFFIGTAVTNSISNFGLTAMEEDLY